ncbi:MAG: alpha/beta hydrolase [Leptolyngbyaceae cyanobacterium SL_7_1]|nr:alpha/beta hydrolase [Leptolyngbyaceae cyanobacterium SL_7_1]
MSKLPDVLWLSVSPALRPFDRPLMQALSQTQTVGYWEYAQTLDEPNSFDAALVLLHDYLKHSDRPLHLIGHSTSGVLGLLYARQHPERVRSLTLLSVGVHPAIDWQAHYYAQAQLLRCSRSILLSQMVYNLFGRQPRATMSRWVTLLEEDLLTSLSPHTLFKRVKVASGGVTVPLMVCGGGEDIIIDPPMLQGWQDWMREGDRLWLCSEGGHFFHYHHPDLVDQAISEFWALLHSRCSSQMSLSPL